MDKHVLVIDDEDQIRGIYRRMFSAIGLDTIHVFEAKDATQAVNVMIRRKLDLVLLDINVPELNGQEIYEIIQEFDPKLKVIVASVHPIDEQKKMIPFAKDYYDKSQGPFKLLEKVTSALVF